jgi:hypothetical protein
MLNVQQFRSIYDGFLESGLSIRDYCANQQLKESMFYYWQNKLKGQLPPKRGFVPLIFDNGQKDQSSRIPATLQNRTKSHSAATANNAIFCEITYPNGVCLKLDGLTDPQMLRPLLILAHQ